MEAIDFEIQHLLIYNFKTIYHGNFSKRKVAELIADETTLNSAEALMALRQLFKILIRLLLSGNSVKLGNWATISITLNCRGVDKKEDLKATDILRVNANFQPGEDLKNALQKAEFIWIDKLVEGKTPTTPGGGGDSGDDRPVIE